MVTFVLIHTDLRTIRSFLALADNLQDFDLIAALALTKGPRGLIISEYESVVGV